MRTVQSLRQRAEQAGNLRSTEQQNVVVQDRNIIIEPAQPEYVYVPVYNPTVIYGPWWAPDYRPWYWYPPPIWGYPPAPSWWGFTAGFYWGTAWADPPQLLGLGTAELARPQRQRQRQQQLLGQPAAVPGPLPGRHRELEPRPRASQGRRVSRPATYNKYRPTNPGRRPVARELSRQPAANADVSRDECGVAAESAGADREHHARAATDRSDRRAAVDAADGTDDRAGRHRATGSVRRASAEPTARPTGPTAGQPVPQPTGPTTGQSARQPTGPAARFALDAADEPVGCVRRRVRRRVCRCRARRRHSRRNRARRCRWNRVAARRAGRR